MTEIGNFTESIGRKIKEAKAEIRKSFAVTGMTAKTRLREGESLGPERTLDERVERGEMYRILRRLKKMPMPVTEEQKNQWKERRSEALKISRDLKAELDVLNRQYYSPEYNQFVDVEVLGEKVGIPVRRYSLRENDAKNPDSQNGQSESPIVIIGGATSGPTVTKGTAEAFALQYPNRDVYVIGYPDSRDSKISKDLPEKLREHGNLATYTKINKDVLLEMGFESFDLVGISMGGGIVLQAGKDIEFARRINNLIAISPTNIQETEGKKKFNFDFAREYLYMRRHPRQWVRVPQTQHGYKLGSHKDMGFSITGEIARKKHISSDDLASLHVQDRVIILTGDKDALISCEQIKKEVISGNEKRATDGKRRIEFMEVQGARHSLGVAYAAGIVAIMRNTSELPSQISVKELPTTTAEVFVRENPQLSPVAGQILK